MGMINMGMITMGIQNRPHAFAPRILGFHEILLGEQHMEQKLFALSPHGSSRR